METMNISLPDPLKTYIEELVGQGDYSSASEYVRYDYIAPDSLEMAQRLLDADNA